MKSDLTLQGIYNNKALNSAGRRMEKATCLKLLILLIRVKVMHYIFIILNNVKHVEDEFIGKCHKYYEKGSAFVARWSNNTTLNENFCYGM